MLIDQHETIIVRNALRDLVQAANGLEREFRSGESLRLDLLAKAETAIFKVNKALREAVAADNIRLHG